MKVYLRCSKEDLSKSAIPCRDAQAVGAYLALQHLLFVSNLRKTKS